MAADETGGARFIANGEVIAGEKIRRWRGSPGEFLARLWALFGPPHSVAEYFVYYLRDTDTGLRFHAGVISGGPSYGVAPPDIPRADAVLDDFDRLLASVEPVNCSVELWPGELIGYQDGTAFDRVLDPRALEE